jgi:hypothetical protein
MEREEDLRYRCLIPPQIKSWSPTPTTNGATRYDELTGGVGSAHLKVHLGP